jgi:rubrerythrin
MDRDYLSIKLAETLGNEYGVVEAEHKLMNDGQLEPGMKRQLLDMHDEDERHVRNLERALEIVGRADGVDKAIDRGKEACLRMIAGSGDDPIDVLRSTILAKYKSVDAEETFFELCDEIGEDDACELFEVNIEEEEDHIEYLREQAMLMTRERVTGEPVAG